MTVAATVWSEVESHTDYDLLRLHGDLSVATARRVGSLLGKLLHNRGAVVVDVADLRLGWAPAVEVFTGALAAAGGWPAVRLVLAGAGAELSRRLRAARTVPVVADLADAAELLWKRPERVSRHHDLPAVLEASAAARALVRKACADWSVSAIGDVAALVVSELVTNVVEHARSSCRVSVSIGPAGMHVSVRDYAPGPPPRPRPVDLARSRGRGLHIVSALASSWGVSRHPDGKTIWAVLALPG
jgi:anti-sigma regulatory factor (Ser/Thr protein kinase)